MDAESTPAYSIVAPFGAQKSSIPKMPAPIEALSKATLVDQAVRGLLKYIHDNNLQPGAALPSELVLARTFGVSRPVVREALRALQGRSVVDLVNGVGAIVRPIDGKAFNEFILRAVGVSDLAKIAELEEARHGVEAHSAYMAAERRTDAQVMRLGKIVEEMKAAVGDRKAYWRLNIQFHTTIAEASGNSMVLLLIDSLLSALDTVLEPRLETLIREELWPSIHPLHEEIFRCIRDRAPEAARQATMKHLELGLRITRAT